MRARRRTDGERGAAAVEFALVLPVLLLLIFGIVDFGRMLNAKITITEAAREGARAAALVNGASAVARVDDAAGGLEVEAAVTPCPATPSPDANATVVVRHTFTFLTPLGLFFGSSLGTGDVTMESTGIMPCLA